MLYNIGYLRLGGPNRLTGRFICRKRLVCCLYCFALTSYGIDGSSKVDFICLLMDDLTD
jgi:hypothetical protein